MSTNISDINQTVPAQGIASINNDEGIKQNMESKIMNIVPAF